MALNSVIVVCSGDTHKADFGLGDDVWKWNDVFISRQVGWIGEATLCLQTKTKEIRTATFRRYPKTLENKLN